MTKESTNPVPKVNPMTGTGRRNFVTALGAGAAAALAAPSAARAQSVKWRMVTSWPRNLPGPGVTARRLADRIRRMSKGGLDIKLHSAGEIVSGLEVLDAVSGDVAQIGHTASFFWAGKMKAAAFFTTVPFGLTPLEHIAWIEHGGGQALWDELYGEFGVKPFMAGNSGMQMGGWLRREVNGLEDLKGLKFRIPGLGGAMMKQLGVTPVLLAPADILPALQTGAIDGTEFLGPWSDRAAGFHKVAPYYYWPGFHEPNGTGECMVNLKAWAALDDDLKAIVEEACRAENAFAAAESEWENALALDALRTEDEVVLRQWPADVVTAARSAADDVMSAFGKAGGLDARIYRSFSEMKKRARTWSRISTQSYLAIRNDG